MTSVVEGEQDQIILVVEEVEKRICLVVEEEEEQISGEEATASIIVSMPKAEPTADSGRTTPDIMTMSRQVTKGSDQMSNRW